METVMVFAHQVVEGDLGVLDAGQVLLNHELHVPPDHRLMNGGHILKQVCIECRHFFGLATGLEKRLQLFGGEQAAFPTAGHAGQQAGVQHAFG